MLVERAGEVVTREEVRQRLWPENTFVEFDNSLGVAIRGMHRGRGFRGNYQSEVVLGDIPSNLLSDYEEVCLVCETNLSAPCG